MPDDVYQPLVICTEPGPARSLDLHKLIMERLMVLKKACSVIAELNAKCGPDGCCYVDYKLISFLVSKPELIPVRMDDRFIAYINKQNLSVLACYEQASWE